MSESNEELMAQEALIALLSEQSAIVNEKHASIWRSLEFSAAPQVHLSD